MNRLPSLFVSHGAPTYALEPGDSAPVLTQLGVAMARPRAVLVVSPHWMTRDIAVSTLWPPQTVHALAAFPVATAYAECIEAMTRADPTNALRPIATR